MEWQLKPSTWDLDVPQQAENDNHAMRSSNSVQIHNGQWGLQEDDYRGGVKVCMEGLVGKIQHQNHNHDAYHITGASQKGFHSPVPSTSGTNTTSTSRDSGYSSGFPAASITDCSNRTQQPAPFPCKDPVKLRNYSWLYSGNTEEMPRVASGLNAGNGDNTNHSNNYANDADYRNQQQQGYNSTINGSGAQLIGANGGGGGGGGSKEIIIASKRRYPKEDGMINRSEGVLAMATGSCAYKKHRNKGSGGRVPVPRCQVDGCKEDLSEAKKDYHRRHKVCEMHSKAPQVITSGIKQRFCQQCSRFHAISEFDDSKRSCRRRLAGHNERRRKSSQDTGALSLASIFQDDRRHLNYFIQHPLSMPLPTIYKKQDTRRSRSELEEACRAQLALMNAGILPRNAANRLLSILHANKVSSSSPHDVLKYSNTNNHDNNNNPSIGEGLTLCSSNSININGGSQPSSGGANSILAASLEVTSQQQLGLHNSGRALSLLSSGGGGALSNPIHHRAVLDPEILNHPIITSSCSTLNANFTRYHGHHHHQDQYQVNNNSALIPLFVDDNYPLKNPKLFTNSPRSLALSIGISTPSDNVDQPLMSDNSNDILAASAQGFASSAHGLATEFSQHLYPFRAYESSSLFTGHANLQSHV